jgi:hypothetical protein
MDKQSRLTGSMYHFVDAGLTTKNNSAGANCSEERALVRRSEMKTIEMKRKVARK